MAVVVIVSQSKRSGRHDAGGAPTCGPHSSPDTLVAPSTCEEPTSLPHRQQQIMLVVLLLFAVVGRFATAAAQASDRDPIAARAAAARERGDIPQAISLYKELTEADPRGADAWWFLGMLQYDANQYAAAQQALTHYIQLTPRAGPALALRALCEFETGQYAESLEDLQHGISLGAATQPRNARIILYHQAILLTRLGAFEQAIETFRLLAAQPGDDQDLRIGLGLAGLRVNLLPKEVQPDQVGTLAAAGDAALSFLQGNRDEAEASFQTLFSRYPGTPNAHYLYGYLLFATRPEAAVTQFQQELAVSQQNAAALAMYAWALDGKGNYAEAVVHGAKAVAAQPSLAMAQLAYGKALADSGNLDGALPHLEEVLRAEPENLEAHFALVTTFARLGRSDDARRERLLCLSIANQGPAPVATP